MKEIGYIVELKAIKTTPQGVYLINDENQEVLLPNKYVPRYLEMGDSIEVFVYTDFKNRPVATTLLPKVQINEVAALKIFDISDFGAFADWGLEKHLLIPFSEQHKELEKDKLYLVYLYKDDRTNRMVGSTKIDKRFRDNKVDYKEGDKVHFIIGDETPIGYKVVVENKNLGMIYKSELYQQVQMGDRLEGFITKVREDNKLDISLNSANLNEIEELANRIYEALLKEKGAINISDKSEPELIYEKFQVSKKAFKRALGLLYSERKIVVHPQSIVLAEN